MRRCARGRAEGRRAGRCTVHKRPSGAASDKLSDVSLPTLLRRAGSQGCYDRIVIMTTSRSTVVAGELTESREAIGQVLARGGHSWILRAPCMHELCAVQSGAQEARAFQRNDETASYSKTSSVCALAIIHATLPVQHELHKLFALFG